jgi:PleD family two-component response regulator
MATSQDKILIVDPFKNLLDIYRMFLEKERYEVETASSLMNASQKFSLDHYAVLISEYLPPFEETFHMLHQLKEHSPETYIIIVTNAIIDDKTYERLFSIGVEDLIIKPYSPEKILVHVKKGFRTRNFIIGKQELERESQVDPITHQVRQPIFNLTHFGKCLRQELKKAKRHGHPLSLILMGVPDERIPRNQRADFTVELIRILRNNTREEDIVGRGNGGFGVLLAETDEAGSQALVKRLLHLIQTYRPFQREENLRSTAGVVSFQTYTYPEKFIIPESLKSILGDLLSQSPRP